MPQNERSLKWHKRSCMLRNNARRVVSNRATRRNRSTVSEGAWGTNQVFATMHGLRNWVSAFLPLCVELDSYGFRVHITKEDMNLKEILLPLFLNARGAESQ